MFDEENQNGAAPHNLPAEPEDMFSGVDQRGSTEPVPDALSNGLLKKKERTTVLPNIASLNNENGDYGKYTMSSPVLGKIIVFLMVLLLLGGGAYGAWWFLVGKNNTVKKTVTPSTTAQKTDAIQTPSATTSSTSNLPAQINNDQILFGQGVDVDKDGLDDVREREIKTNPQNPDTDSDGLNDGEEVIVHKSNPLSPDSDNDGLSDGDEYLIWKTNILNPDSDNDTYPDGTEVKNGYNPLGPGRLFNNTSASSTTSAAATSTK